MAFLPEDFNLQQHYCENPESWKANLSLSLIEQNVMKAHDGVEV
jgi:hypothetical protein